MYIIINLLFLDQISKYLVSKYKINFEVIPHLLNITYTENRGTVFGVFQGYNIIIAVMAITVCLLIFIYVLKLKEEKYKSKKSILYMILAGGIGNIIDRVCRGFVVDFIDTPFIATFNFADMFIVLGVIILIFIELKEINKVE